MTLVPVVPELLSTEAGAASWSADQVAAGFLLAYSGNTRAAYRRDLSAWSAFCADVGVDPLQAGRVHVDAYARRLTEVDGLAASTVARRLSCLSGFYRWAVAEDIVAKHPMVAVRRPKAGTETVSTGLDKDEVATLLAAAVADGPRAAALVALLTFNGLRVSEALGVDVSDLGNERGHRVLYITRKGGKRATVPLAPRVTELMDSLLADRTSGPLFATASGARMDRAGVWRLLRKLARRTLPAKATSLHPHDLRHAFVTLSLDAGASLRDVQDAAGHADPRTTRRYDRARHNLDRHPTYQLAGLIS